MVASNDAKRYRPGLPTMSLGHGAAGYSMRVKLAAIAEIGFEGVEVSAIKPAVYKLALTAHY